MARVFPQGLDERHESPSAVHRASWWRLGIIGGVLLLALSGLVGGWPAPTVEARSAAGSIRVTTPDRLRNGMFFETRIEAQAARPLTDAVIAVPAALWRDMTINTMIPAPSEEAFRNGEFRYHFGPLAAGESLGFKIDGQINPARFGSSAGRMRLMDGDTEIVAVPVAIKVIP